MKKTIKILVFAFLFISKSWGQEIKNIERYEIPHEPTTRVEHVIQNSSGKIALFKRAPRENGMLKYEFVLLRSSLSEESTQDFLIDKRYSIFAKIQEANKFYILFMKGRSNPDFNVCIYDFKDNSVKLVEGKLPEKFKANVLYKEMDFENYTNALIAGKHLVIPGELNSTSSIASVDLETGKSKSCDLILNNDKPSATVFKSIMRIGSSNEFGCLAYSKKLNSSFVFIISEDAEITQTVKINIEKKFNLLTGTGTKLSDNKYFFSGTFNTSMFGTESEGIFSIAIKDDKCLNSETHNFFTIKGFIDNLPEQLRSYLKTIANSGSEYYRAENCVFNSIVSVNENEIYVIGESRHPVGDGFFVHHRNVMIFKFDNQGNKIWEKLVPTFFSGTENKNCVSVNIDETSVEVFAQCSDEVIHNKYKNDGSKIFENIKKNSSLNLIDQDNIEKYSSDHDNEFWYGDFYISYGKEVKKNSSGKQKVFFINKFELK